MCAVEIPIINSQFSSICLGQWPNKIVNHHWTEEKQITAIYLARDSDNR